MKRTHWFIVLFLGISLIGLVYAVLNQDFERSEDQTLQDTQNLSPEDARTIITRTSKGYEPSRVVLEKGDTVLWKNESGEFHWPASDIHPTHKIYSEFDSQSPVGPGELWAFTFERVGEWQYHDHLRANRKGNIIVK